MTSESQRRSTWRIYLLLVLLAASAGLVYHNWPRDPAKEFRRAVYQGNRQKVERMLILYPALANQANNPPLTAKAAVQPRPATMNFMEEFTVFVWEKTVMKPVRLVDEDEEFRYMEEDGMPPLQIAVSRNDVAMTRLLLTNGAKTTQSSRSGMQALYLAVRQQPELVKLLLEHGADARSTAFYGHTPLHFSTHNRTTEAMELLLKAGADPNIQNRAGQTPLHNSVHGRNTRTWELLLQYGARLDITNRMGKTALDLAREYGQTNAVEFLSARQAPKSGVP